MIMNTFKVFSLCTIKRISKTTIRSTLKVFFEKQILNKSVFTSIIYLPVSQNFPVCPLLHKQEAETEEPGEFS
jgi:arginine decarboxylase-like protein